MSYYETVYFRLEQKLFWKPNLFEVHLYMINFYILTVVAGLVALMLILQSIGSLH